MYKLYSCKALLSIGWASCNDDDDDDDDDYKQQQRIKHWVIPLENWHTITWWKEASNNPK